MWSMGVICYVLLAGYPPFYDEDQKRLFKKIKEGRYHFHEDYWSNTSPEAIDMIRQMLCVDQSKRWTAEQLLKHPWITMGAENLVGKDLSNSITVMRKFNARRRLRAAADAVIMANRMNRLLGGLRGAANTINAEKAAESGLEEPGLLGKKKISLIDPDALGNTEHEAEEFNQLRQRMSFDSDMYGDAPSINPALDLLNDKELEGI